MNIIVVVSDTLRRDYLPPYGNNKVVAPSISDFAKDSVVFDKFYAASFPTVPARADLFTGQYTFTNLDWGPLPKNQNTLAQHLTNAGYLTCGVADTPFLLRNGYGHDRGFQDFFWIRGQRIGEEHFDALRTRCSEEDYFAPKTFRTAIRWLERHHTEKFFLHIDTWDPHEPWDPPEYYVRPYYPDYAGEIVDPCYWEWEEMGYTEKDLEIAKACYCGEITMVDRWFGYLLDFLKRFDLLSTTAVFFMSDHGFALGEHGLFGKRRFKWPEGIPFYEGYRKGFDRSHGLTFRSPLHNEVTRIPLIAQIPGISPKRISPLTSIPDVMPTLLELADVKIPNSIQARSMVPLMKGNVDHIHDFVITSQPLELVGGVTRTVDDLGREVMEISPSTMTDGDWDFLYAAEGEPIELYQAKEDPSHKNNIAKDHPDVVKELHAKFYKWLEKMGTPEEHLQPRSRI